jgi:predicted nucleic acid-binding protein
MSEILRICLDLNIWCAALLAESKGRQNTSAQCLVSIVREGTCLMQPVQLVISWGMLNRLRKVLVEDWQISMPTAELYLDTIMAYAELGAMNQSPQLTLGGTGILPMSDIEDGHVLETAIAGQAHILVTANLKDFRFKDVELILGDRHARYKRGEQIINIVHPYLIMDWIRGNEIPI